MPQYSSVNRRIVLNSRPVGAPTAENFGLLEGKNFGKRVVRIAQN
jgi:NADPH-dependent curcumin reductase CurA